MGSGAGGHFDRLQIDMATLAQTGEDDIQQRLYFPRPLEPDRIGRFFSCGVCSVRSTGRKPQFFRLTSTNSPVKV